MNPDQPLPQTAARDIGARRRAEQGGHAAWPPPSHKARPVPALLMKRPAREPENV